MTIQEVDVNRDFSRAKVYFSVFGTDAQKEEAGEVLNAYAKYFRSEVNRAIRLRNSPEIVFVYDNTPDRAARIHALLDDQSHADNEATDSSHADVEDDG